MILINWQNLLKKYLWKENCDWHGRRVNLKLDEKTTTNDVMEVNELKNLLSDFNKDLIFECDLKKKIGLILVERQKFL